MRRQRGQVVALKHAPLGMKGVTDEGFYLFDLRVYAVDCAEPGPGHWIYILEFEGGGLAILWIFVYGADDKAEPRRRP